MPGAWFGGGYGGDRGMFDGSFSYMGMSGMMLEVYFNMHQDQQLLISGHYYKNGRMIADWIKSQEEVAEAVTFGTVLPEVEVKGGLRIWQWGEWRTKMRKRYGVAVPFVESTFNKFAYDQDGKDPWVRAKRMGYMPWNPDAGGITLSLNVGGVAHMNGSLSIGFIGSHIGVWYSYGTGVGTPDVSIGITPFMAEYKGAGAPTPDSYMRDGDASNVSVPVGKIYGVPVSLNGSYGRGFNDKGETVWDWDFQEVFQLITLC